MVPGGLGTAWCRVACNPPAFWLLFCRLAVALTFGPRRRVQQEPPDGPADRHSRFGCFDGLGLCQPRFGYVSAARAWFPDSVPVPPPALLVVVAVGPGLGVWPATLHTAGTPDVRVCGVGGLCGLCVRSSAWQQADRYACSAGLCRQPEAAVMASQSHSL